MTKARAGKTGRDTFTEEQVIEEITVLPDVADAFRREGLAQAVLLGTAQTRAAEREQVRRRLKYGAASPQAAVAERRVALQRSLATEVKAEAQRARTERPQGAEDRFILHGRVTDQGGLGLPGLTVAMIGPDRSVLEYACTDKRGYFLLTLMAGAGGRGKATAESARDVQEALLMTRRAPVQGLQSRAAASGDTVGLQVSDARQRILHRDPRPVTPRRGGVEYREIRLGDGDGCEDCAPPPDPKDPPPKDPPPKDPSRPDRRSEEELARERAAKEQAAKEQAAKEQAAKDRAAREQAAKDQAAKDQAAKEQAAKDRAAKEQAAKEQAAKAQAAREQAAREQAAKAQAAKEQAAREQASKDQAAKAQAAKDAALRGQRPTEPVKEPPGREPPVKEPPAKDPPVKGPPGNQPGKTIVTPERAKLTDMLAGRLSGQVVSDTVASRLKGTLVSKLTTVSGTKKKK